MIEINVSNNYSSTIELNNELINKGSLRANEFFMTAEFATTYEELTRYVCTFNFRRNDNVEINGLVATPVKRNSKWGWYYNISSKDITALDGDLHLTIKLNNLNEEEVITTTSFTLHVEHNEFEEEIVLINDAQYNALLDKFNLYYTKDAVDNLVHSIDITDTYNGFNFDYSAETGLLTITMIDKTGHTTTKTVTIFSDKDKYVTSVVYEETSKQFVFTFNNGDTITCPFSVNLEDYPTNNQVNEKINNAKKYVDDSIANLTAAGVGGNGKYIKAISEANGVIFAVEETMDITPTNGSDKAITSGAVKKYVDETLEDYAKKDGYYETFGYAREAGIAKNLQNDEGKLLDPDVTTSGGTVYADAPFTQRATAMTMKAYIDNELITVGSGYEQWKKEQAFSIVRNQLRNDIISLTNDGLTIATNDKRQITVAGTRTNASTFGVRLSNETTIANHKYFIYFNAKETTHVYRLYAYLDDNFNSVLIESLNKPSIISVSTSGLDLRLAFQGDVNEVYNDIIDLVIIDLTQWFASKPAIATALNGDAGVKWFLQNYPQALTLGYDEGTIVDTEDYDYETTGVNLWDEEWELGALESNAGLPVEAANRIRSKNFCKCLPNIQYYLNVNNNDLLICWYDANKNYINASTWSQGNRLLTSPANAVYFKIMFVGTTYKNDIQICQHFTETSVEQTYHKYEIFKDKVSWAFTSTGKGKSAGSVADTKDYVNKKNIEKVGQVDLGTLNWSYDSTNELFYTTDLSTICKKVRGNAFTSSIYTNSGVKTLSSMLNIEGQFLDNGALYLKNTSYNDTSSFKSAMNGKTLNYELATPIETDMSGDELVTNIPENDYGVERKVPVSGNMFSGSATTLFYQDNPLRQIYNNKSSIDKLQTDLSNEETTRSALQNVIGGTLRQCLCVKESLDFDNTDFVDLGTIALDTSITSVDGLYRFTSTTLVGVAKGSSSNNTIAKCLCTKIKTNSIDNTYLCQTGIAISPSGLISIFVQGINNDEDMKTYLKGQLLAYEKASS